MTQAGSIRTTTGAATLALLLAACGGRTGPHVGDPAPENDPPPTDAGPRDSGPFEQCNGLDDDGDGEVDETCACVVGTERECAPPPPPDAELCETGTRRCINDGVTTRWGGCVGVLYCRAVRDTFVYSDAVDIVWVVDQSWSMRDELDRVRRNFAVFGDELASTDVDYGVVLLLASDEVCPGGDTALCSAPERFHQLPVAIDTGYALVETQRNIAEIEAHLRPWSGRAFVLISDDDSFISADQFDRWLLGREGYDDYVFHAVVGTRESSCPGVVRRGIAYMTLADRRGGHTVDVCTPDWSTAFEDLAERIAARPRYFELSEVPLDGVRVFEGEGEDERALSPELWRYDPARNAVVVYRDPALDPGTRITVRYRAAVES